MIKLFVKFFILIHYFLNTRFGFRIHGLGKVQFLLKRDFHLTAFSKIFYYNSKIEGSYDYLLIGKSNEPETHLFLGRVIPLLDECCFIDVGASIGEFVIAVCNYRNVTSVFAFEPRPDCASVIRMNKDLNKESRITVFENAVSDTDGDIELHLNAGGTSSGIYTTGIFTNEKIVKVKTIKLDNALPTKLTNAIMLVDVEGAEPLVLNSGAGFIKTNNPLIIFEYNSTSKKYFQLSDIQKILGDNYLVYRLKANGGLDQNFSNSWNCVAIPLGSTFEGILKTLM